MNITKTPTHRVEVVITLKEMYDNYMDWLKDAVWNDAVTAPAISLRAKGFQDIIKALAPENGSYKSMVVDLFRDGYTAILMGDAMLELSGPVLRHIVVDTEKVDDAGEKILFHIYHEDIDF